MGKAKAKKADEQYCDYAVPILGGFVCVKKPKHRGKHRLKSVR